MSSQVRHSLGAVACAVAAVWCLWQPATASAEPVHAVAVLSATTAPKLAWSTLQPGLSPPARTGAAMAYDATNGYVLLFGGTGANGQPLNDTWEFNGTTWAQGPNQGSAMPALTDASMAYDAALGEVLLFGGINASGVAQNATWTWNPPLGWQLQPQETTPPGLAGRYDATLANLESFGGSFVLYGGLSNPEGSGGAGTTTSTTTSTTASSGTPSAPSPTGSSPAGSSRTGSGAQGSVAGASTLNDTWTWNGTSWTNDPGTVVPALSGASGVWDPDQGEVLMFGGATSSGALQNSLWAWDGGTWSEEKPTGRLPPARQGATLTYDPQAGGDVLIGGQENDGPAADIWLYANAKWTALTTAHAPAARDGASAVWDSATSQLVFFGGATSSGALSGSTSILSLAPRVSPSTTTTPSTSATSPTTTARGHPVPTTAPTTAPKSTSTTAAGKTEVTTAPSTSPTTLSIGGSGFSPVTVPPAAPITSNRRLSHPGQQVVLSGGGYTPGARIALWFHSTPVLLGYVTANSAGYYTFQAKIPANAAPGDHSFEAQGLYDGKMGTFTTGVQITPTPPPGRSHTQTLVLVLVVLLIPPATWFSMALAAKRHRRAPATG